MTPRAQLSRQVNAVFGMLATVWGPDRVVLKAGKLGAMQGMRSNHVEERVLALQRIVFEDPTIDHLPTLEEVPEILDQIQEELADLIARRSVEEKLEKKIAERMQERHEEYVREIKMQIVKEDTGPENQRTLARLEELERLESINLARSAHEVMRPKELAEIVGQDRAVAALMAKVASPYPQHVIMYGPPGTGKTTAARLVLEHAKSLPYTPFAPRAPFIEVDGTTLRWDPREVTNPLLGSVHDPIYQGARRDLAEGGIPEPKTGLVTEAHGGILFIDEIGELDPLLLAKLLKVLEDKRVRFDSSYYDPDDQGVPKYIRKLFGEGAPADFVLIGATTRDPSDISPAIRSRCAEVFFEPLTPTHIATIVRSAADRLGVDFEPGFPELTAQYTVEGRKAVGLLADVYGMTLYRAGGAPAGPDRALMRLDELHDVIKNARMTLNAPPRSDSVREVGRVFGLGVLGYMGSVLEIEAVAFRARRPGRGSLRFNETAGSMAKDSVFNAAAVVRRVTGENVSDYDLHVNIIGGGHIDGPSAGTAILVAVISAMKGVPIRQDIGVTGEVSIQGKVKAVGGIVEKLHGARQAGLRRVILPSENQQEISAPEGVEAVFASTIEEVLEHMLEGGVAALRTTPGADEDGAKSP
ncbi:MAG: Lon family ATP-dependent protease [Bacillota bacterium]|nr:Lon family ATP-dependent protease [Bacillota bacterium]